MTVSLHKMSAGKGYQYLLRSVVAGDGNRSLATPLTRYYTEAGTPPGYWVGRGITQFGAGELSPGAPVTEQQLQLLIGIGRDPLVGTQLGEPYRRYATKGERVAERVAALNPHLSEEEHAALVDEIDDDESAKRTVTATAGFDCTFSVPKSVSVLWGVSDAGTQALIVQAHHEAVADVLALLEREVAATRAGVHGRRGAVLQKDVMGVAATAYDHWDSRAGDPQLHTHVVVANKVRTLEDGKWRTLDGRPLYASVVGLSEHYNAVLADKLTRTFGLEWERRDRGPNRSPGFEITGVSEELIGLFSHRSHHINEELEHRIAAHVAEYGRRPSARSIVRMRADITVETRPPKHVRSLAELTDSWRARAARAIGTDATQWARDLTAGDTRGTRASARRGTRGLLRADDMSIDVTSQVAKAVVGTVSEKRATWRHWNLWAEASRQTVEWRFASSTDREAAVAAIVKEAKRISIALTPPEFAATPRVFRRDDGTSRFRPTHSVAFTSAQILDAEDRLLAHAEDRAASIVDLETIEHADPA